LTAWSGRADGPPTARSNVGVLVRTFDPDLGRRLLAAVAAASPRTLAWPTWRDAGPTALVPSFGEEGAALIDDALRRLQAWCPELGADALIHAPAIEGVGDYPADDGDLQLGPGLWVAGDACGRFRGIFAALISGRYVAERIRRGTR
jgi:hypothetical protein